MPRLALRDFPYSLWMEPASPSGGSIALLPGTNYDIAYNESFSWSQWIYLHGRGNGIARNLCQHVGTGGGSYSSGIGANNKIFFTYVGGGVNGTLFTATTDAVPHGEWLHLVITKAASGAASGVKIYINGVSQAMTVTTDTLVGSYTPGSDELRLCANTNGAANLYGNFCQWRWHNGELSQDQVNNLYYNNVAALEYDYVACDEGTGATLTSTLGSTAVTTGVWYQDSPFHRRTAMNDFHWIMEFDGNASSDVVSLGVGAENSFDKTNTDAFAISCWLYARPSDGINERVIYSKTSGTLAGQGYCAWLDTSDLLNIRFGGSGADAIKLISINKFPLNSWHHLCISYDGTSLASGVKVWLDTADQNQVNVMTTSQNDLATTMANAQTFVYGMSTAGNRNWNGMMTRFVFHSAAQTAEDVQSLYYDGIAQDVFESALPLIGSGSLLTSSTGSFVDACQADMWELYRG